MNVRGKPVEPRFYQRFELAIRSMITNGTNNFSNSVATLTFVAPQVVPNVADQSTGVNYFLTYDINPFAPVFRDLNNNGIDDSPQEDVSMGALIANTTSFQVLAPKIVVLTNTPPLTTKNAGILEYPDAVLFTPDDSIAPASATQGDTNVPVLKFTLKTPVSFATLTSLKVARTGQGSIQTQGSNDDIALVKIYRDANFNGTLDPTVDVLIGTATFITPDPTGTAANTIAVNLFKPEVLDPTGQTYFIAYDFATGATSNNSEGVSIQDPGWFSGSFVPAGVDTMRADNMPHNSREVTISPLLVRVSGTSIAQSSVLQGTTNFPLLSITVTPSINQVIISTLTLTQIGTIQYSIGNPPNVVGDGDISKLYVYVDNNLDGKIDFGDTLVGSINWGLAPDSSGGPPSFLSVRRSRSTPPEAPSSSRVILPWSMGRGPPPRDMSPAFNCPLPSRCPCSRPRLCRIRPTFIRFKAFRSPSLICRPSRSPPSPCGRT